MATSYWRSDWWLFVLCQLMRATLIVGNQLSTYYYARNMFLPCLKWADISYLNGLSDVYVIYFVLLLNSCFIRGVEFSSL